MYADEQRVRTVTPIHVHPLDPGRGGAPGEHSYQGGTAGSQSSEWEVLQGAKMRRDEAVLCE